MKLHPDGTIEGSPQEILEYKRLIKTKDKQDYLMEFGTKEIINELSARTGVHKYDVSPEGEVVIREGKIGCIIEGPAIVLEIKQ